MDGVDSFIFALVFIPSIRELLPASGFEATPANIASAGSVMFALFLIGWGMAFIWGPLGDKFSRARTLALTIIVYSVFTGAAAFAQDVYQLAIFRFLAGIGVGGEWALAGTFIPRYGQRIGVRRPAAICRPDIMSGFSSRRRLTSQ